MQTTFDDFQNKESSTRPIPRPPTEFLVAFLCMLSATVFGVSIGEIFSAVAVGMFVDVVDPFLE